MFTRVFRFFYNIQPSQQQSSSDTILPLFRITLQSMCNTSRFKSLHVKKGSPMTGAKSRLRFSPATGADLARRLTRLSLTSLPAQFRPSKRSIQHMQQMQAMQSSVRRWFRQAVPSTGQAQRRRRAVTAKSRVSQEDQVLVAKGRTLWGETRRKEHAADAERFLFLRRTPPKTPLMTPNFLPQMSWGAADASREFAKKKNISLSK